MGEPVGQWPVVGEQQQPLGFPVEPSNREDPRLLGDHPDNRGPAFRVRRRAHHARRLVQQPVPPPLVQHHPRPVDLDPVADGVDPPAEVEDHRAAD
jgi:hypothetical protein